eukprot:TRINITY_DN3474_c1_g1_i2.p2 TRINITY_DN3474_c1_g1~~TRINITY_DN3474_c1_g1_i2.p2  ORF type:complete len:192 (+),score=23.17 TRINITY_DN3474_c1_g1_i2:1137-1712(+)
MHALLHRMYGSWQPLTAFPCYHRTTRCAPSFSGPPLEAPLPPFPLPVLLPLLLLSPSISSNERLPKAPPSWTWPPVLLLLRAAPPDAPLPPADGLDAVPEPEDSGLAELTGVGAAMAAQGSSLSSAPDQPVDSPPLDVLLRLRVAGTAVEVGAVVPAVLFVPSGDGVVLETSGRLGVAAGAAEEGGFLCAA